MLVTMMQLMVLANATLLASEPIKTAIPTKGLMAYYPFSGSAKDTSGKGSHASVVGAMLTEDKFGNTRSAYLFDGKKDYMTAPVCISSSVMPQVTMVAWAKTEQDTHNATIFSNASDPLNGRSLLMRPSPSKGTSWASSTNASGWWVWHKVEVGKWTFLAISYDQSAKKLYVHVNDRKYEADCIRPDGNIDLAIGKNPHTGDYFQGCIDEVRVYNRILSEDEIAALYHQFQNGDQAEDDPAIMQKGGRSGLLVIFITGFALFASIVLVANIMIRKKTMPV